ncbi:hypothetical protein ACTD5D_20035 [Nocardia takedensis]|nr:hypothetical protein [Nocardia takedensis]
MTDSDTEHHPPPINEPALDVHQLETGSSVFEAAATICPVVLEYI